MSINIDPVKPGKGMKPDNLDSITYENYLKILDNEDFKAAYQDNLPSPSLTENTLRKFIKRINDKMSNL